MPAAALAEKPYVKYYKEKKKLNLDVFGALQMHILISIDELDVEFI